MSVVRQPSLFLLAYAVSTATIPWQSFCGFRLLSWSREGLAAIVPALMNAQILIIRSGMEAGQGGWFGGL
jgi:hypothetical protein